jgi:hypothetical protein
MGQAKRRGTFEERKANPLGDQSYQRQWTEEEAAEFKAKLLESMKVTMDSIKKSLFSPTKRKTKKFPKIKTGG